MTLTQKGIASFSFVLLLSTRRATTPASLFVPALHALTRMGVDRWNDQVYRRRAGSAQLYRRRAGSAQLEIGLVLRRARLAGRSLVIEHTGCAWWSAPGGTRVRGSGVCTAVNGFVPLTGRRTHLVLHYIYIVFTTPGRMPHRPHSLEPNKLAFLGPRTGMFPWSHSLSF